MFDNAKWLLSKPPRTQVLRQQTLGSWAVLVCGDRAETEREGLNYKNMLT